MSASENGRLRAGSTFKQEERKVLIRVSTSPPLSNVHPEVEA